MWVTQTAGRACRIAPRAALFLVALPCLAASGTNGPRVRHVVQPDGSVVEDEAATGIVSSFTNDAAGEEAVAGLHKGDSFWLQLHAQTGGYALSSFAA